MDQPKYIRIYNDILSRIEESVLVAGDTLETEMEMTRNYGVSRVTVRKAMEMLVNDGYLSRIRGKGTVVTVPGNRSARPLNFRSGSHKSSEKHSFIGLILPEISSSFGVKVMEGIEKEAEKSGYYLVMKLTKGNQELEEKAIRDLIDLGASGLIIQPQHGEFFNPVIMELSLKGFPFVLVDLELRGLKSSFIGTDHKKASYTGVQYLIELGHRDILYMSPPVQNTSALEDRLEGVKAAFIDYEIPINDSRLLVDFICTMPENKTDENLRADKQILKNQILADKSVTAIFACEYHLALLASLVLKELDLRVPEDISILCFDAPGDFMAESSYTHLKQSELEMGIQSMDKLKRIMEGDSEIERIVLPVDLIEGSSTVSKT